MAIQKEESPDKMTLSQLAFDGIGVKEAAKRMEIEMTEVSVEHNSCVVALRVDEILAILRTAFMGVEGIKIYCNGDVVLDHDTPCHRCESDWGFAHEVWCPTRWED